jgi:hypothetical protein
MGFGWKEGGFFIGAVLVFDAHGELVPGWMVGLHWSNGSGMIGGKDCLELLGIG